jgi:hypothetical protein
MKTGFQHWLVPIICLVMAFNARAQGYLVPNGVVTNLFPGEIDLNWPQETQVNGFSLTPTGKQAPTVFTNIFNFNEPATIGVRVFLVNSNDALSLQPILSGTWTELQLGNNYVFANGTPFYVGLYSGANVAPPYPPTPPYQYLDPVFGWAELENVQGSIVLLNSALEYGGNGIYAGTPTIIQPAPEPGTLGLVALGGLLLTWARRK